MGLFYGSFVIMLNHSNSSFSMPSLFSGFACAKVAAKASLAFPV
jgi:hypothetical protein